MTETFNFLLNSGYLIFYGYIFILIAFIGGIVYFSERDERNSKKK